VKYRKGIPKEKPVVIIRRKSETKTTPSSPGRLVPKAPAPVPQAAAPATPPLPRQLRPPSSPPASAPPAIAHIGPSKKEREKQARRELLAVLRERWPRAFPRDYHQVRPLAIGVCHDLASYLPEHPPGRISFVIRLFQERIQPAYFHAVIRGGPRYDLEGKPRGEVTATEQAQARQALRAFNEARQQSSAGSAPPPRDDTAVAGGDDNKK
jgi:ProQ/FINO family